LVTNNSKDVEDLQVALRSLLFLQGDAKTTLTPVLIFNEGDLSESQIEAIRSSTNRPIAFPEVDLTSFPTGFDPAQGNHQFKVKNRKSWGYYQMIRFWITGIWVHPAIQRYEIVMRMDSDSCFKSPNSYLPYMAHDHLVYHSQYVGVESGSGRAYIEGLFDFAVSFMSQTNKQPGNVLLWHFIERIWTCENTLPLFRTNMEITRRSFMLREDVVKWHHALTEEEPFGVLKHRWGDAITRFMEVSIFATGAWSKMCDFYFHLV